jgi:hypothetical protein
MLDQSILQTKTAGYLVYLLKLARTITKTGSNHCKEINDKIDYAVVKHEKAKRTTHLQYSINTKISVAKIKGYATGENQRWQSDPPAPHFKYKQKGE